jgi:hypothetical protein
VELFITDHIPGARRVPATEANQIAALGSMSRTPLNAIYALLPILDGCLLFGGIRKMVVYQSAIYSALVRKKLCTKAVAVPESPELIEILAHITAPSASARKNCEPWLRIVASAQNTDPQLYERVDTCAISGKPIFMGQQAKLTTDGKPLQGRCFGD